MSWWTDFRDDILKPALGIAAVFYGGYLIYNAITAASAVASGMAVADATAAGISLGEMAGAGLTATEAVAAGATAESCMAAYTASQCFQAGIAANELLAAGASAVELLGAGATVAELAQGGASIASLVAEGASAGELISGGASVGELIQAGVSTGELLTSGASVGELMNAGLSIPEIVAGAGSSFGENMVINDLLASGYTASDLAALGVNQAAIVGEFTNPAMIESLINLPAGQTVQGLTGSQWAAVANDMNYYSLAGVSPEAAYNLTAVGYTPTEIVAAASNGTLPALSADAAEYLAWANSGGGALAGVAGEAATSAVSADLIAAAEASADPIGTLLQGMGYGSSSVAPEVIAAAEASSDPIGALIAGIEAGGSGDAAVAAATNWSLGETALAGAGAGEVIAGNADKAAIYGAEGYGAGMTGAETAAYDAGLATGAAGAAGAGTAAGGFTAGELAAAAAAGALAPSVIGALTGDNKPTTSGASNQFYPIPTYTGGGLVNPGVNPGFIKPTPLYNPESTPGINQYNWGAHGYVQNPEDMANYNMYAPAQPYGNPNAQNLGRLITPEQLGYPSLQSASATQGTSNPVYYNPVPQTARMQQQFAAPVQPAPMAVPDVGHSLYIAPAARLASTNTSGKMTPNEYTAYLNNLALEAAGQT